MAAGLFKDQEIINQQIQSCSTLVLMIVSDEATLLDHCIIKAVGKKGSGDPWHENRLCRKPGAAGLGLTVFTLGALLSEGNRREHVKGTLTKGFRPHKQNARPLLTM